MIDLILIVFVAAVFYGGFYAGAKWGTLNAMKKAVFAYFD